MSLVPLGFGLLLFFIILASRRVFLLWKARQQDAVGSRLHLHLVVLFSFMSLVPTALMLVFSGVFFNVGVESWLGQPIQKALRRSHELAVDYLRQHQNVIKFDIQAISSDLATLLSHHDPEELRHFLSDVAEQRGFSDILIFNRQGRIIAKSFLTFALTFDPHLIHELDRDLEDLQYNTTHLIRSSDRVKAIARIDQNHYLFAGRVIDQDVQKYLQKTQKSIQTFEKLSQERHIFFKSFMIIFGLFSVILLTASIWAGLAISNVLLYPIRSLIRAAQKVSQGILDTRVRRPGLNNEIDTLADAFNQMVVRLKEQKSALVLSERKAAWADVARKIAHEIKNPLTPIQLSAERLKRRYLKEIHSTPEDFKQYVDTIIRHVGYIQNLVQEFSSFARMPEPKVMPIDVVKVAHESLILLKSAYPFIDFDFHSSMPSMQWNFDPQQLAQVFANLLQNAVLTVKECKVESPFVHIKIEQDHSFLCITIEDNGPGFPKLNREALLEPYYTTRREGTGLGLAIVNRIVRDHQGHIDLQDRAGGGACVVLRFEVYTPLT